jgi:lipopolysaccharide/colanic/teichoic acid biosynthesis glycosyltransferase
MYKIRSMIVDAEVGGAMWAQDDDQRVTRVGRVMRKLHIDELVQLYNVLRGEMSLVGPRPERPEFVEVLRKSIAGYEYRTLVLPGMSGFAQLNYPSDAGLDDVYRKLILDLEYIEDASFCLDMRILAGTFLQILCTKFSKSLPLKLFGIYRTAKTSRWLTTIGLPTNQSIICHNKIK